LKNLIIGFIDLMVRLGFSLWDVAVNVVIIYWSQIEGSVDGENYVADELVTLCPALIRFFPRVLLALAQ
jgi:hypothetical protein